MSRSVDCGGVGSADPVACVVEPDVGAGVATSGVWPTSWVRLMWSAFLLLASFVVAGVRVLLVSSGECRDEPKWKSVRLDTENFSLRKPFGFVSELVAVAVLIVLFLWRNESAESLAFYIGPASVNIKPCKGIAVLTSLVPNDFLSWSDAAAC